MVDVVVSDQGRAVRLLCGRQQGAESRRGQFLEEGACHGLPTLARVHVNQDERFDDVANQQARRGSSSSGMQEHMRMATWLLWTEAALPCWKLVVTHQRTSGEGTVDNVRGVRDTAPRYADPRSPTATIGGFRAAGGLLLS